MNSIMGVARADIMNVFIAYFGNASTSYRRRTGKIYKLAAREGRQQKLGHANTTLTHHIGTLHSPLHKKKHQLNSN